MTLLPPAVCTRVRLGAVLALSLGAVPAAHAQSFALYDNFTATLIAPTKWAGDEGRAFGGTRGEEVHSIVNGQAHFELRTWGDTSNDSGPSSSRSSLVATKSAAITAIQSAITMRSVAVTPCSTNTAQPAQARARLFGFFFNAADPSPGSSFNDVFAGIQVYRASNSADPATTMRISGFAGVCTDESCFGSSSLGSVDLGTIALNATSNFRVTWDQANNRFLFQRDATSPLTVAYTIPDSHLASNPAKRIEVSNVVPHCTSPTRPSAFTSVDFDNVYTNALP